MSKKEDARRNGQVLAFGTAVLNSLPRELSTEQMKYWVGHQGELAEIFREREVFVLPQSRADKMVSTSAWADDWTSFYREVFDLKVNLSEVKLPTETKGFGWLVVVAQELGDQPLNIAMAACRKLFGRNKVWQYADDLDKSVTHNDRDPRRDGSYAIRVRNRVEADEENTNLSAIVMKSRNLLTMTLLERIILELFYFWKTAEHLESKSSATLCSGSYISIFRGIVLNCSLRDNRFTVGWVDQDYYHDGLRARSVVF